MYMELRCTCLHRLYNFLMILVMWVCGACLDLFVYRLDCLSKPCENLDTLTCENLDIHDFSWLTLDLNASIQYVTQFLNLIDYVFILIVSICDCRFVVCLFNHVREYISDIYHSYSL